MNTFEKIAYFNHFVFLRKINITDIKTIDSNNSCISVLRVKNITSNINMVRGSKEASLAT